MSEKCGAVMHPLPEKHTEAIPGATSQTDAKRPTLPLYCSQIHYSPLYFDFFQFKTSCNLIRKCQVWRVYGREGRDFTG